MSAEDDELASPLRHIALEGATNFRDIGGYVAAGGRSVRWRSIYRSDSLSNITQADMQRVAGLGLRSVYDLRNGQERHAAPDQLPQGSPNGPPSVPLSLPRWQSFLSGFGT
jgi:protein-tyrosine phosphatase